MSAAPRYVVMGLVPARATWWREVAGTAGGAVPLDAVRAGAVEEVRARLRSGRPFSALLVDAGAPGLDRDLIELATAHGCAVVVVDDPPPARPWTDLGAALVLPSGLDGPALLDALHAIARPIGRWDGAAAGAVPGAAAPAAGAPGEPAPSGRLVVVTGRGGVGTSTVAASLAAGLAPFGGRSARLVLGDLALGAQQRLLHGVAEAAPGLPELVEAHRSAQLAPDAVRRLAVAVRAGSFDLLPGIRRHRDWTAVRPRALAAALSGLRRAYDLVVAEVEPDVEGEAQCGSVDIEDRNLLARTALREADLVVVAGRPGTTGVHGQVTVVRDVLELGVAADRLVVVVNRAPRGLRARTQVATALGHALVDAVPGGALARPPVLLVEQPSSDGAALDDAILPPAVAAPLVRAVRSLLDRPLPAAAAGATAGPVPVVPGSLATWAEDADG